MKNLQFEKKKKKKKDTVFLNILKCKVKKEKKNISKNNQ